MWVVDYMRCSVLLENDRPLVLYENQHLEGVDGLIPRIGSSMTVQGAALLRQFELMGVPTLLRADGLLAVRDKLGCLQAMSASGLAVPKTAFIGSLRDLKDLIPRVGGFPMVIKLVESTHGIGVVLAENLAAARSSIEVFLQLRQRVILQEFIAEAKGTDIRAFVVGGKVVAAMQRHAAPGDFRSNLHCGGTARPIKLKSDEQELAINAARITGLEVAGVDLLRSDRGPLILEINASPGLKGIERTSKVDVSGQIIQTLEKKLR